MISSLSFLFFVFGDNYFNKTGKKKNPSKQLTGINISN